MDRAQRLMTLASHGVLICTYDNTQSFLLNLTKRPCRKTAEGRFTEGRSKGGGKIASHRGIPTAKKSFMRFGAFRGDRAFAQEGEKRRARRG